MPPGRVLLDLRGSRRYYAATAVDQGFRLRFFGTCDVDLDPSLTRATVHPMPGADPDLLSVLVSGTLLAFVLTMRGETVLHASAVQVGDAALAFVGASGMGKSTMATLLCADGARLVTDDVLRLDTTSSPPTCALGATELRLRKGADHLSERFANQPGSAPALRTTGDARQALAAAAGDHGGSSARGAGRSPARPLARAPHHRDHAAVAKGGDGAPLPVPTPARMAGRLGPPGELPPARGRRRPGAGPRRRAAVGSAVPGRHRLLSVLRATGLTADDAQGRRRGMSPGAQRTTLRRAVDALCVAVCRGRRPDVPDLPGIEDELVRAVRFHRIAPLAHVALRDVRPDLAALLREDRDRALMHHVRVTTSLAAIRSTLAGLPWATSRGRSCPSRSTPSRA